MSNLAANPSGSGIYGQPNPMTDDNALGIVNQLKDREMKDFMAKANFMSDLSLKQDRMKRIYDVQDQLQQQAMPQSGQPNIVMGKDPNAMTGYEKGELGVRQQGLNLESQRLAQTGKLGQEALDVKSAQEKLNQQKSDQANAAKQADMERKINEANQKIELAQQALQQKTANAEAQLQAHKDLAAAMEERHKLELAQKDAQFQKISDQHQQTIDALQERLKQQGRTKTTVEQGGETRTTTTERGSAIGAPVKNPDGTYTVTAPDGSKGIIPGDKLDDWMQNHHPGGEENQ